jgi:hypothetical protein
MPAGLEDPAQEVADEGTGIADVQRPGRVSRYELDIDPLRLDGS